jgi:hypothetical protein
MQTGTLYLESIENLQHIIPDLVTAEQVETLKKSKMKSMIRVLLYMSRESSNGIPICP